MQRVLLLDLGDEVSKSTLAACSGLKTEVMNVLQSDDLIRTLAGYLVKRMSASVTLCVQLLVSLLLELRKSYSDPTGDLKSFIRVDNAPILSDVIGEVSVMICQDIDLVIEPSLQWLVLHCVQILRSESVRSKELIHHDRLTTLAEELAERWEGAKLFYVKDVLQLTKNIAKSRNLAPIFEITKKQYRKISDRVYTDEVKFEDILQGRDPDVSPSNQEGETSDVSLSNQEGDTNDVSLSNQQDEISDVSPSNQQGEISDVSPSNQEDKINRTTPKNPSQPVELQREAADYSQGQF
jgi:hypothetical protein